LERSLTVLLPVQNVQSTLADTVAEVLEVASDWTQRIELLIIDDGSTDATSEVAHELVRHYPQVRAIRHSRPLGREEAVRTGLAQSRGDTVVIREPDRLALQRLHHTSKPARPNYLGRPKQLQPPETGTRRADSPYA
jgi:glycosyltransferase involved in cell wall biosynthesis